MQTLTLETDKKQKSQIVVGKNIQAQITSRLSGNASTSIVYICDSNTHDLLKKYIQNISDDQILVIKSGENSKTIDSVQEIIRSLIDKKIGRKTHIVGFGGGVVTDMVGFAASIYLRGVDFSFIPTTLLGMIDAAIGGKNGVDFAGYKNIIGTINQPQNIFVDTGLLESLPEDELRSGMGELIKYAVGFDIDLVAKLENADSIDDALSEDVIAHCIDIKIDVVKSDPLETMGMRKLLNLGHTLGHAIETQSGFAIKHGYGVAIGLNFTCFVSNQLGMITSEECAKVTSLLEKYTLPTRLEVPTDEVIRSLFADKKRDGNTIDFVVLKKVGEAGLQQISIEELKKFIINFQNN